MSNDKKILVYKDYGVEADYAELLSDWVKVNLPRYKVGYTDATSIINLDHLAQDGVKAIFMPGGQSRCFKSKLEGEGDRKIQEFVEQGGAYYGFCGGSYYPCENVDFTGDQFSIKKENSGLVFFNGLAKGSIAELTDGRYYDDSLLSCAAAKLSYDGGKKADIYYHGGPRFIGDFNNASCEVLATYDALTEGENAAVIKCKIGNGYAVLTALHPEVDYNVLYNRVMNINSKDDVALKRGFEVKEQLENSRYLNDKFNKFLLSGL